MGGRKPEQSSTVTPASAGVAVDLPLLVGLPPIIDDNIETLIFGSFPSPASLTAPATEGSAPLDLTPAAASLSVATTPLPAARPQVVGPVGGPYVPIAATPRRNEPLDLASFMRSSAGR